MARKIASYALVHTADGRIFQLPILPLEQALRQAAGALVEVKSALEKQLGPPVVETVFQELFRAAFKAGLGAALFDIAEVRRERALVLEERRRLEELRAELNSRAREMARENLQASIDAARNRLDELLPEGDLPPGESYPPGPEDRSRLQQELDRLVATIPGWPRAIAVRLAEGRAVTALAPGRLSRDGDLQTVSWPRILFWKGRVELYGASDLAFGTIPAGSPLGELPGRLLQVVTGEVGLPVEVLAGLLAGRMETEQYHLQTFGPDVVRWVGPAGSLVQVERRWVEKLSEYRAIEALAQAGLLDKREATIIENWLAGPSEPSRPDAPVDPSDPSPRLNRLLARVVKGREWHGSASELLKLGGKTEFLDPIGLGRALAKAAREGLPGWIIRRERNRTTDAHEWVIRRTD